MDIGQFYAACNAEHREFFSTLIHEWTQAGLPWNWTDDGNIALCARTANRKSYPVFFVLHNGTHGRQEAIYMKLDTWHESLGHADTDRFITGLRDIDGLENMEMSNKIVLPTPGHAFGSAQHQLRRHIHALAFRLRDLIGT